MVLTSCSNIIRNWNGITVELFQNYFNPIIELEMIEILIWLL